MRHPLHDALHNTTLKDVTHAMYATVDALQTYRPEQQIAGLAAGFLLLCERFDYPPARALEAAENMIRQARYRDANTFEAARLYMQETLR